MKNYSPFSGRKLNSSVLLFLPLLFGNTARMLAQETTPVQPVVKLSGFVKTDLFFDSRQTVAAREGHLLLFPAPEITDGDGNDINAKSGFNILPIHSNLCTSVTGFQAFGASVSGLIEGDFFGGSNNDVNMLRLRHACIRLRWSKTELVIGQFWHPMFVTSCYPGTVSYNTGTPIQPFSRAPQIRLSQTLNKLTFTGALVSQRDYSSYGPDGASSKYLRDSGLPEVHLSGELNLNSFIAGSVFGYKRLVPQIKTADNYTTSESVRGISANIYLKHVSKLATIKLEGIYLENASEVLSISGFAVKDTINTEKGLVSYEPVRTFSCWGEIHSNGEMFQFGLFSGYTQNLGTKQKVIGPFYSISVVPIKSLYRVSPRFLVKSGNLTLACEVEYTSALFGTPDNYGIVINTSEVTNIRFLLSTIYKF